MINNFLLIAISILLLTSCATRQTNNQVKNQIQQMSFFGQWKFYGPFGKAATKPIIVKSYVRIDPDGTISYKLMGEDREWCNEFPRLDIFSKCEGVEQENGSIIEITKEKIFVDGSIFSPTLEYSLSKDGKHLKLQDINLYKD